MATFATLSFLARKSLASKMSTTKMIGALALAISLNTSIAFGSSSAATPLKPAAVASLDQWLSQQEVISAQKLMANVSPSDAAPGVVVASPERNHPNYYFHWVRDAALTMDTVFELYVHAQGDEAQVYLDRLIDFARFSRQNQMTPTKSGMGEPKFNYDGSAFNGDWCRPQNDGPALRAVVLTRLANYLLDNGQEEFVRAELYDSAIPTNTVIKADLEFTSHHWTAKNCDIWEEVYGDHFYTRMAQKRSLIEGAKLAARLGDGGAAQWYRSQANALDAEIAKHWDSSKQVFVPHLGWSGGLDYKHSGLDAQTILAILHTGLMPFSDARVQSTLKALTESFRALYPINKVAGIPGVGIGRYPEDKYDGMGFQGGNPWVLITAAFANGHYRAALELINEGHVDKARAHFHEGDELMKRIQYHAYANGSLSEQMDRHTGYMTAARDLTWSHSEVLQANWSRKKLLKALKLSVVH